MIPCVDQSREANVRHLLQDLEGQTLPPVDIHVVRGVRPSGRARNHGARKAEGDVLIFLDDDVRLGHSRVVEEMVRCLESAGRVGMVGAAQLLPPGSSWFQRAAARQIPRSTSAVVSVPTDSDMVTTACCAIRRPLFWQLGGFREDIARGVDPEFRYRLRKAGWRTMVAPNAWYYHPMPANLADLCQTYYRNGWQSAQAVRRAPELALENPDGHAAVFRVRRSAGYRAVRHGLRLVQRFVTFRWLGLAAQVSYLVGYVGGRLHPEDGDR